MSLKKKKKKNWSCLIVTFIIKIPHKHSAVLLPDVCQGHVVDKQHAGQVELHTELFHQCLDGPDPAHVAVNSQGLNQPGDGELRGHVVLREHGLESLQSVW